MFSMLLQEIRCWLFIGESNNCIEKIDKSFERKLKSIPEVPQTHAENFGMPALEHRRRYRLIFFITFQVNVDLKFLPA